MNIKRVPATVHFPHFKEIKADIIKINYQKNNATKVGEIITMATEVP